MKCLHCDIAEIIAQHVIAAKGAGETVDVLPVAYAVAKALGQVIASADDGAQRVRLLLVTRTAIEVELAVSDAQDRAAAAEAGERVQVGSVH